MRYGKVDDGTMQFSKARPAVANTQSATALAAE
jgi:hypothetical protein